MLVRLILCLCAIFSAPISNAQIYDYDGVPLPDAIKSATSPDREGFSGAWSGLWSHRLKHILLVDNVQPDGRAEVVYAHGDMVSWGINRDWQRYPAQIEENTLTVLGNGFVANYRKLPSGVLMAEFQAGRAFSQAVLHTLDGSMSKPKWTSAKFEKMRTELFEAGEPIAFEIVTFKPDGPGPYPLAIVNHGSTGDGKNPAVAKLTFVDTAIAQFLVDRGYIVVFPQRRGRGTSDGLYDEGFNEDRAQGYSCDTRTSLAGAERAITDLDHIVTALSKRPDVSSASILLSGVSRGGILSMAYAGHYPRQVSGVINFVGGWMAEGCPNGAAINDALFVQAAEFPHKTLSLYGENDPFYSIAHTKERFEAFEAKGGQGTYVVFDVPGGNGHALSAAHSLWAPVADAYLDSLERH
ncbi:Dienelactone hydrolase [Phaeobacter gallaeciensis]|uniref:Dienelactone hydrolase n=1 Tax=Phaeobacter gallaeciensis TaxID=60890 RepID=A0AAD0EEA6_9RHOB|nr:Dienelactone hydrolase [Phaeobacter gallaeciensis DSM 26640]ATE94281.1 Dienelactone hydrolase [Phaeobacter gallaeciensis]ATE95898.1 Dienelactone hydrolase [Phaeobacter gallaeciensis]ATF02945.1 Dienelactone hydrolase [Phaeobacter gallaeciensis]ATF07325.1 Dienelactone hydrolase [Phaeobacter gallaeciensis]